MLEADVEAANRKLTTTTKTFKKQKPIGDQHKK